MIGPEKTANIYPHRAEGIEYSVKSFYPMRFALSVVQFIDWSKR